MRNTILKIFIFTLICLFSSQFSYAFSPAARTLTPTTGLNSTSVIGYYESLPKGYDDDVSRKWPLIIYLHGSGARSTVTNPTVPQALSNLPLIKTEISEAGNIINQIDAGAQLEYDVGLGNESFVVLAPQVWSGLNENDPFWLNWMINHANANYRIDPNRIYVAGFSQGGMGLMNYLSLSVESGFSVLGDKLAAIALTDVFYNQVGPTYSTSFSIFPSGAAHVFNTCGVNNANLPIWFTRGTDSSHSANTLNAYNIVNTCMPVLSVAPILTTYTDVAYGVQKIFNPTNTFHTPNLYQWFLGYTKSGVADNTRPTLTINQAVSQTDPTSSNTIAYTIVFSEAIDPTTFVQGDMTLSGTGTGTIGVPTTSDNITWNVEVTATAAGTYILSMDANKVSDAAGNVNTAASTSTDNSVTYALPVVASSGGGGGVVYCTETITTFCRKKPENLSLPQQVVLDFEKAYVSPLDDKTYPCNAFTKYLKLNSPLNDLNEVRLWQAFLNKYMKESLPITGIYDLKTVKAIKNFQSRYKNEVLKPWRLSKPTGYTYKSTRLQANKILGCPEGDIMLDNGVVISSN